MKQHEWWSALTVAGLLAALPMANAAPGDPGNATPAAPAPAAAPAANQTPPVRGRVTAVDATAKTITLAMGRDQTATTLHVSDATKYLVDATGTVADLKVGQTVRVNGQTTDSTITARFIQVVPATEVGQGGSGGRRGVQGVIATVTVNLSVTDSRSLTITTADKQTYTVQTDANTRVTTPKAGTLADVKADEFVTATTTGPADNPLATTVHVRPAGGWGGRRGQGGGAGQPGANPAPAAPATPAAPKP